MRTLFEITEDFAQVESKLEALDDLDNDAEAMSELMQWMTDLSNERAAKIDAYCWLIRKLESEADTAKQIAIQFREKADQRSNKVEMLKSLIMQHMKTLGHPKLFGKQFTVAIQKNGGSLPVEIVDEHALPDEFCEFRRIPLKGAIRAAMESGQKIEGAVLGERGESVRIK